LPNPPVIFTRLTPASTHTGGAVSLIQISAAQKLTESDAAAHIDAAARRLGLGERPITPGTVRLHRIKAVDDVLAARISPRVLHISTHAGRAVEAAMDAALLAAGITPAPAPAPGAALDPRTLFPEARSLAEACALDALSQATSPDAVRVLLAQVPLWDAATAPEATPEEARQLNRLLHPPSVAVIGPANIGKSTLLNALARADVALAFDQPGTTLDHLGVTLTLAGLTLHWLDTPGWHPNTMTESEQAAHELARAAVAHADLILNCADATAGFIDPALMGAQPHQPILQVATRADLGMPKSETNPKRKRGPLPESPSDSHSPDPAPQPPPIPTAAATNTGLETLAQAISNHLVPQHLRRNPPRWPFHPALPQAGPGA
jgi:hypothetical protein